MSGPLLYDFGGLVTAPGLLARNPASCIAVNNFRFPQTGVMRKRPGFAVGANTAGVDEVFWSLMSSNGLGVNLLAQGGGTALELYRGGPSNAWSTLTDPADIKAVSGVTRRARLAVMGAGAYVTGTGIRRLNAYSSYRVAGMPKGMSPWTYSMDAGVYSVLTGTGFIPADSAVAYRVTWHVRENGADLGGAPTSRLVIRNIAGTSGFSGGVARNVNLRIPVPYELDSRTVLVSTAYFYRLWRSHVMAVDTPSDEMYLVAEAFVTAGDISAGYASVTDITPDAFLLTQPRLHTNSLNFPEPGLQNGQLFADDLPPSFGRDLASWSDCMWYAAPFTRISLNLNLISASFTAGNTIVITAGVTVTTLTAVAGVPVNPGDFTIVTGLGSLSLNIEATARNIVDAFNRTAGRNLTVAYYVSQGTQDPGLILLESAGSGFTTESAAAGNLFRPSITTNPATRYGGGSNGGSLFFSKPHRADAVPPCNVITIGPPETTILRVTPFRERLLVWTTRGLYQVDGTFYGNFTVSLVDSSLRLLCQETVVVQGDACYAWCFEGIAEITDGGTRIVSGEIEPTIESIKNAFHNPLADRDERVFAVSDRVNHLVYFFYQLDTTVSDAARWLEFDTRTRKWNTGSFASGITAIAGVGRDTDGRIILARGTPNVFAPIGVARFYAAKNPFIDGSVYFDTDDAGGVFPVISSATFQLQTVDPDARWHWQQLLLHFEDGDIPIYARPNEVRVTWQSDVGVTVETTLVVDTNIIRTETPVIARRATRQRVTLRHVLGESCGVIAVNQTFAETKSRFPR